MNKARKPKAKFKGQCWLWPYSLNKDGYGQITINKKYHSAHKFFYELVKGKVPCGCELDHLCKNKNCVNPEHLEPVSHAINCRRGKNSKLSEEDIMKIKKMSASHSHQEIAKEFDVSRQNISLILSGKRWRRKKCLSI